jgi:hypothetical protein
MAKKASYVPVLEIKSHFAEVSRSPYIEDILGEKLWKQGGAAPGVRSGFVRQALSKEFQFVDDPLLGQIPFRPRLMHHDYRPAFNDRGIGAWEQITTPEEIAARATAREYYTTVRDAMFVKGEFSDADKAVLNDASSEAATRQALIDTHAKLSVTQKEQLASALSYIPQFAAKGSGFLKEVENMFDIGQGVRGILWDFSVPNVPKTLISTFELKQDQWQTFRIFRSSLPKEQAVTEWELLLSNGTTQYAFVFRKEEGIEFRHYKNMKPRARFLLEQQLEAVLNTGRLTPEDRLYIASLLDQVNVITKASKDAGQSKPIGVQADQIAALKKEIKQREKDKSGLDDYNRALKEKLEKKLYYDTQSVTLQEDTRSLFNTIFDLGISFHRKGYIGVRISKSEPVYIEIKAITKTLSYGTMLPRGCRAIIRSRGGKFYLGHGNPDFVDHSLLYGQPFSLPYSLGAVENVVGPDGVTRRLLASDAYSVELDAVGVGEDNAAPGDNLALLPNCSMTIKIEQLQPLQTRTQLGVVTVTKPAIYRICLDSYSLPDATSKRREFSPEIYRGSIFLPGESAPLPEESVWESRAKRYPISDVLIQDDEDRASIHEVHFEDGLRKPANLPLNLEGSCCDLYMLNQLTGEKSFLQQNGIVKSPGASDVGRIIGAEGGDKVLELTRRAGSGFKLDVHGLAQLLNRPVRFQLIGNNRPPAEYVRDIMLAHGIPEWFSRNLPSGDVEGLDRLPKASAGQPADIKPAVGVPLINFIRGDVVLKHCIGWRFVPHPTEGALIEEDENRERPDLAYSTRVAHDDELAMLGPLHFRQNTENFASEILVLGAFDPAKGERFSSYSRRYEASRKKTSSYFTGTDHTYIADVDESLKSQAKVDLFARQIEKKKGLPPIEADQLVWYRPDLRTGLIPTFDGVRFLIIGIQRSSLKIAGRQQCVLTLRLAEDIPFAIS